MYDLCVNHDFSFDTTCDLMSVLEPSAARSKAVVQSTGKRKIEDEFKVVNHILLRNCELQRSDNPCLSGFQLVRENLSAFDFRYVEKGRGNKLAKRQEKLTVFEDGSLKKNDDIHVIDEMLALKSLYQLDHRGKNFKATEEENGTD